MNDRRIGRFKIAGKLLQDAINTGHGQNLFVGMVPLDIQRDWVSDVVTFTAWHQDFAPVPQGRLIPEYIGVFHAGETLPTWQQVAGT